VKKLQVIAATACCLATGLASGSAAKAADQLPADKASDPTRAATADESGTSGRKPPKLAFEKLTGNRKLVTRGVRKAKLRFEIGGNRTADIMVSAVHRDKRLAVKQWHFPNARSGVRYGVTWKASRDGSGIPPQGEYVFRIREVGVGAVRRDKLGSAPKMQVRHYIFPIVKPGSVSFGDGWGAGRGHRGADAFAKCGRKLMSARAGKVVFKGNQPSGAGRYLVIRGKGDGKDLVYMHMKKKMKVKEGDQVKAGQAIGKVGETGNARGCHLHFEVWKGKWYAGGKAQSTALKLLRRWQRWY